MRHPRRSPERPDRDFHGAAAGYSPDMIRRVGKNLAVLSNDGLPYDGLSNDRLPGELLEASRELEQHGFTVLRGVLTDDEVEALVAEARRVFDEFPPERARSDRDEFRYEMLNRSELAHRIIGHPRILAVIEPLLGDDCHVIANTLWCNPPEFAGGRWHCDAGPHVPRPADVEWDERIPYPVFAIGAHILLRDCTASDGPTAVVPGSHRSGRVVPANQIEDPDLTYDGRRAVLLEGSAGDVALFVSDAWHRGTPASGGNGRLFLQAHYGRRDIAQRIRTTAQVNHLTVESIGWADTPRRRELAGLHEPYFYDG
ncbi:MAG: mitomycin antibiotics/polyketide fumonisin biosynthesis protein [Acidimicrobiaceae bacterium]|nr:MAG: mitomycin antibiotics/polyketide fumonisin biosynthesis protein [Acidimicrobiaceae bacterium]